MASRVSRSTAPRRRLSVLCTLAAITLVLPNYTRTLVGPFYAPAQLAVRRFCFAVALWRLPVRPNDPSPRLFHRAGRAGPRRHQALGPNDVDQCCLLLVALVSVVLLAKALSPSLEAVVEGAGLPHAFVGVVIAAIVLLPEGIAAVAAARADLLQTSLNLALGSALASIGLTIPAVAMVSIWMGQTLTLGLAPEEMTLLILTLLVSTVTLATGRTTILQGAVHLVILGVFLFLSAMP